MHITRDEHARQVGRGSVRWEFTAELAAAALEQFVEDLGFGKFVLVRDAFLEGPGIGLGIDPLWIAHQDAVITQHREELAGKGREKIADPAVLHHSPFCVCAGETQYPTSLAQWFVKAQRTQNLRFLATHDIRGVKTIP